MTNVIIIIRRRIRKQIEVGTIKRDKLLGRCTQLSFVCCRFFREFNRENHVWSPYARNLFCSRENDVKTDSLSKLEKLYPSRCINPNILCTSSIKLG